MTTSSESKNREPHSDDPFGESELPPLDHDEPGDAELDRLGAEIELEFGGDADPGSPDPDDAPLSQEEQQLATFEDELWLGSEADESKDDIAFEHDALEQGWIETPNDVESRPVDDWFIDELASDHGGAGESVDEEPVVHEIFALDHEGGALLPEEHAEEDDAGIEEMMSRLRLGLPSEVGELAPRVELGPAQLLESHFIGPSRAATTCAAFLDGSPIAAGDGLFVPGADGMLHFTAGSEKIIAAGATSLAIHLNAIFVGTAGGGVFVTRDRGLNFSQRNEWLTQGLPPGRSPSLSPISTSFRLAGQQLQSGFRLVGRTGEGQLFASIDGGRTWRAAALEGRVLAAEVVQDSADVLVLVEPTRGRARLFSSWNLVDWTPLPLPEELAERATARPAVIAASCASIAIGIDDDVTPLYLSTDCGASWVARSAIKGVTAIALDPEDPGWIAVAVRELQCPGIVKVSEDSGRTFKTALVTGLADDEPTGFAAFEQPEAEVIQLVVHVSRSRRVLAVTSQGVYHLVLARALAAH